MAIFKKEYSNWEVDLGDPSIKAELGEQLKVSDAELCTAINAENVSDKLFARVLKIRSKSHKALLERIPGANTTE